MANLNSLLFPKRCIACGEVFEQLVTTNEKRGFCDKCNPQIIRIKEPICKKCGKPLADTDKVNCEYCSENENRYHFSYARSVFLNEGIFTKCMYKFKYSNKKIYSKIFADEAIKNCYTFLLRNDFDVIVPVPLHKNRLKSRGYNQSYLFAKDLSDMTGIPVDNSTLKRQKETPYLKEMSQKDRQLSLKNTFNIGKNGVLSKKVLLVDDIFTTGATADEASRVLLEAGAKSVHVLCICTGAQYNGG